MKIADIVPVAHLEDVNTEVDYALALAQVAIASPDYLYHFAAMEDTGAHLILDNGAAELGQAVEPGDLLGVAYALGPDEVVLPDVVGNARATLKAGRALLGHRALEGIGLMAVPQGSSLGEWRWCLDQMLEWPISAVGISRFAWNLPLLPGRVNLLEHCDKLLDSDLAIHLLGCPGDPIEIYEVEQRFPGRVRGADSGIAAICAIDGVEMGPGFQKPGVPLDFFATADAALLARNLRAWRTRATTGEWP